MSRHVYYDIDGNEIDEDEDFKNTPSYKLSYDEEVMKEMLERIERLERIIFGGSHD